MIEMSNLIDIVSFKKMYLESLKDDKEGLEHTNIRFFAMGKELKDDLFLYSYSIMSESTV